MTKPALAGLVLLALAGAATGFLLQQWLSAPTDAERPGSTQSAALPEARPAFSLRDLQGSERHISEWDGRVLIINFWATWCPPCVREIPALIDLQDAYRDQGLSVIGVAIDEPQAVRDFIDPMGINYPVLIGDQDAIEIAKTYGNRLGVLPYSVVVDRTGNIVQRHASELSFEAAETMIKPLL